MQSTLKGPVNWVLLSLFSMPSAAAAAGVIEEVVVTAQKREQSLQDVPISVSVLSGAVIDDLGMTRFEDLATMVPNLHVDEGLASPAIHIRGLGSGASNFAFEQSVGLFVDGVYSGRSHMFENPLFDVAQVEVVRGPQGALFGKNTNAGAISVTTRKPTDSFEASLRGGYEFELDGHFIDGFVSGPMSDVFSGRLAVRAHQDGGYVKNHVTGDDEPKEDGWIARGTVSMDPSDTLKIVAKYEMGEIRTDGGWFQMTEFGAAPLSALWIATDPFAEDRLDRHMSSNTGLDPQYNDTNSSNAAVTVNWELGEHTLTFITAYGEFDYEKNVEFTGTSLGLGQSTLVEDFEQLSQEVRWLSPTDRTFEYVIGAIYLEHDMRTRQRTQIRSFGPFSGVADRHYEQEGDSISVYGSGTVHLNQDWRVTAGVRYTSEDKKGNAFHITTGVLPPTWLPYDLRGSRSENHTNGSINLQWDLADNLMTYVTYATGAKAGGFLSNDTTLLFRILQGTDDFEYEDESAESFEVGMKGLFFENRVGVNVAVFRSDFEDLQVSNFNGDFFVTGNAAEARAEGLEVDATWLITQNLSLSGAVAWLDAKYEDYPGGQCLIGATEADGCDPVTRTQNLAGERLERAPKRQGTITLDWSQPITPTIQLTSQINVTYKSKFYHQPDLDPLDAQGGYHKINARLGIGAMDQKWEVALVGRNLNDEITKNWSFDTPFFGGGAHSASIAPPRVITVEAAYRM